MHIQQANFIARHFIGLNAFNDFWIDTMTGISDGNAHPITTFRHADSDHTFPFAGLDPMNDGIFNQWLNQQAGNKTADLFINIINNRQLIAKTGLLNGNVILNLIQLFLDVDLLIIF